MSAHTIPSSPGFDGLFARLLGSLHHVTDAASLVGRVRAVLDAERVVLVRAGGEPSFIASAPDPGWGPECLPGLRDWWSGEPSLEPSFSRESELQIADERFADAIVCRSDDRQLELTVLQKKGGATYTSYHVAAGDALLRQHVERQAQARAMREEQLRDIYSKALTDRVLPVDTWESIEERVRSKHTGDLADALLARAAVIFAGYRLRTDSKRDDITPAKQWLSSHKQRESRRDLLGWAAAPADKDNVDKLRKAVREMLP